MHSYPVPRTEKVLKEIRARIQRDYEAFSAKYSIPKETHFAEIVKAVSAGMTPATGYPYQKLQTALIDFLSRQKLSIADMNECLEIISAIWNYFPHVDLGMSPAEKMKEHMPEDGEPFDAESMARMMSEILDDIIPVLSRITKKILAVHMKAYGFAKRDIDAVTGILESPKTDPAQALTYLLKEAVALAKKNRKKKYLMADIRPTVRATAAYENHAASKMPNGHFNSRMFQNIAEQHVALTAEMLDEQSEGGLMEFVNPAVYLEKLFETHRSIAETGNAMRAAIPLQEAAHHILDWVGLLDIQELMKYDPTSFALLLLAVAHRISKTGDPEGVLGCSEKKLCSLLKDVFADSGTFNDEVVRIARLVLCGCGDPELMIADVVNSPEDAEERLGVLAPCLKLRSPVNPADLPMRSPFSA